MEPKEKFYQVLISSELRTQGLRLLEHLISKRLIFGGPVFSGPARFLWKNEIVEHDYCWIVTFTREDLRDELIKEAELESAEAVYKRALEGYDQVLAASSGRYTNTSVVDRARTPVKPTKPKLLKNLAAGALLGLLLGFGGALLYELVNRRVRCRDDIERSYGVPVLAEIMPLPSIGSAT